MTTDTSERGIERLICTVENFSRVVRGVSPGARGRAWFFKVTCRVRDAGVVDRRKIRHGQLIAHVQFLGLPRQFVQRPRVLPVYMALEGKQVAQQHPPM